MKFLTYSKAVEVLKQGAIVARNGWNGKGMWLVIFKPQSLVVLTKEGKVVEKEYTIETDVILPLQPTIYMKTVDNKLVAWLPSQADILSDDWIVVE